MSLPAFTEQDSSGNIFVYPMDALTLGFAGTTKLIQIKTILNLAIIARDALPISPKAAHNTNQKYQNPPK